MRVAEDRRCSGALVGFCGMMAAAAAAFEQNKLLARCRTVFSLKVPLFNIGLLLKCVALPLDPGVELLLCSSDVRFECSFVIWNSK